jgi:adenosylhomocysteine nucleosidase
MALLFVAPLQSELEFFCASILRYGIESESALIGRISGISFPSLGVIVARGGHGKTQFGIQTQHLLDHAQEVEGVICFGAAGALHQDLSVGDLVIGTETVEHDYLERFSDHPSPRFSGDPGLLRSIQSTSNHSFGFEIHYGVMASGDEDIVDVERAAVLRGMTEAHAVAWEGAGGARATQFNGLPFLEIRGITDTADHNASTHFKENLELAMSNAASLVVSWRHTAI